ncbi:MAG: serine hydrolase [Candidatus Aminicenantes bacterium]|nr:serine hydrolase [Candidatus Aminicenantes bacterium]
MPSRKRFHLLLFALLVLFQPACRREPGPEPPDDEWPVATPESQGLNGSTLEYYSGRAGAGYYGQMHSLLVVRHGRLVHEAYFSGHDRERLHRVYSVTKTVTGVLVGMALARGWLASLDEKVLDFFPEYPQPAHMSEWKSALKVPHLLTMQSGLLWNEEEAPVDSPQNSLFGLYTAPDWYRHILDLPMTGPPGEAFRYNSGASVLLGGILRHAAGRPADEIAGAELFAPLGIRLIQWDEGSPGICNTGWGLWLRPRDMAKLGELLLRLGAWGELVIVPADWVREMLECHVELEFDFGYGYQTWMMPLEENPAVNRYGIKIAWGYGGQFIFVVPELDMVVASTAANFTDDGGAIDFIRGLLSAVTD